MLGVRRLGLVTPYTTDVQEAIMKNYAGIGVEVVEERHLSIERNGEIAGVSEKVLGRLVEEVIFGVKEKGKEIDAVTTFCTNLNAAGSVDAWESWEKPILDTVAVVIWDMLREYGVDLKEVKGWGTLFSKG